MEVVNANDWVVSGAGQWADEHDNRSPDQSWRTLEGLLAQQDLLAMRTMTWYPVRLPMGATKRNYLWHEWNMIYDQFNADLIIFLAAREEE